MSLPDEMGSADWLDLRGLQFPALRDLHLVNTEVLIGSSSYLENVERLNLSGKATFIRTDLKSILQRTPNITELCIMHAHTQQPQNRVMARWVPSFPSLQNVKIHHANEYNTCKVLGLFLCPKLVSLSLSQLHCFSEPNNAPWNASSLEQTNLPLVLSHSLHRTVRAMLSLS